MNGLVERTPVWDERFSSSRVERCPGYPSPLAALRDGQHRNEYYAAAALGISSWRKP
jgi:hypothetical protein